jgi:hypothetical protein
MIKAFKSDTIRGAWVQPFTAQGFDLIRCTKSQHLVATIEQRAMLEQQNLFSKLSRKGLFMEKWSWTI